MRAHRQPALGICPSLPAPARFLVFSGVVFTLQKLKQKPAPSSVSPEDPAEVGWRLVHPAGEGILLGKLKRPFV